jgi:hypothetical protein
MDREGIGVRFAVTRRHLGYVALLIGVLLLCLVSEPTGAQGPTDGERAQELDAVVVSTKRTSVGVTATEILIPAGQDAFIASGAPDTNYGSSANLRIGYNELSPQRKAQRTYLWFDVNRYIPSNAVIREAWFEIYLSAATPAGDLPMRINARLLNSAWSGGTLTWNSGTPDWGPVLGEGTSESAPGWKSTSATDLVKQWYSGAVPNYGVMLQGDETPGQERQRVFYSLNASNSLYPRLRVRYDLSVDTEPPQVSVAPLPAWSRERFMVSWSGDDPGGSGIDYYDVQYQAQGGSWIDWRMGTRDTSAEFVGAANGLTYGFRARGVDKAGNVQPWSSSAQAWTKVDTIIPNATMNALPPTTFSPNYGVSWIGSDNAGGSGIRNYDIQYRIDDGPWMDGLMQTTQTAEQVTGAEDGQRWEFRARATDNAGNVQPWSSVAQAWTLISTSGPSSMVLPFQPPITNQDSVLVQWTGEAAPGLAIEYYNIRYRYNNGSWTIWLDQAPATQTQATFTDLRAEDGVYCFQSQAMDSLGRLEAWPNECMSTVIVDRNAPFVAPNAFIPLVFNGSQ